MYQCVLGEILIVEEREAMGLTRRTAGYAKLASIWKIGSGLPVSYRLNKFSPKLTNIPY